MSRLIAKFSVPIVESQCASGALKCPWACNSVVTMVRFSVPTAYPPVAPWDGTCLSDGVCTLESPMSAVAIEDAPLAWGALSEISRGDLRTS